METLVRLPPLAVGCLFLGYCLQEVRRLHRLRSSGSDTRGTVTDFVERGSGRDQTRHAVVSFTTSTGRRVTFTDPVHADRMYSGLTVPVKYDPDRPEEARIDGRWRLYSGPALGAFFGLILVLGALFGTPTCTGAGH